MQLGVALVHAVEVAREQRRLLAAGAGADFEDRALVVGLVAGQEGELDRLLELRNALFEDRELVAGERAHLGVEPGIGEQLLEARDFGPGRAQRLDRARNPVQLGELLGERP